MDTSFWPPGSRLGFGRYDAKIFIPRTNLPHCFWIGPPQLRVTSPNGGESWGVGTTQEITWLSENFDGDYVTIEYSTNSGAGWITVEGNAPNTGSYFWLIPATPSNECRVKVSDPADGDPYDESDANFSIVQSDFTIEAAPDTQTVQAGQSTDYDVILTSQLGFASPCTLTVSGLPTDASANFDTNPITPTDTSAMTINTAETTPDGTYEITVTATELTKAQIQHSTQVVLIVTPPPDFTIYVEPDTLEVQAGSSVNCDVILESLYGFASACTLTISGLPTDASESFNPNPVTPTDTSDLQINTQQTTPPDTYTVTVTASEIDKGVVHDAELVLIVTPSPDFTIEVDPDTQEVQAGSSVSVDVILTSLYGFTSPCTLTVTDLPPDASGSFDPDTLTPSGTSSLQVNTAETTPPDTYTVTVIASQMDKGIADTAELVLMVTPPPDFTIQVDPDTLEVQAGSSVDCDVILESLYGFASSCTLTIGGLPTDASESFDPDTLTPPGSSSLQINTAETTPPGTYLVAVIASEVGKGIVDTAELVLIVSFQVAPDTQEVQQGDSTTYEVILTSLIGVADWLTLNVTGLPPDASGSFDPNPAEPTDTSILTINTEQTTPPGTYYLTITATDSPKAQIVCSTKVVLIVTRTSDFTIDVFPDTMILRRGYDTSSYTIVLTSINQFNSPCTLTVTGLPAGAEATFDPLTLTPTDTGELSIFVPETVTHKFYTLTITATEMVGGKAIEHSKDVTLFVVLATWGFYIDAYPDTQVVVIGKSTTYEVVMFPDVGFAASCTLSIESGLPPVDSFTFYPEVIPPNDTSILTIFTASSTPPGIYEFTIKGTADLKYESTTSVILRVDEQSDVEDWADNLNTPKSFALFQNQPNPFNPETEISYYLPKACQVRLTVYNLLGQKVRTLFDGYQEAGMHTLIWEGRDEDGVQASSGIYFYRLQADDFQKTKKMILMK